MNERIKQLVDQCWEEDGIGPADFNPEKFAELIVRECASVVSSVPPCHGDYRDQIEVGMRDYCARKVLEHFGVEE